MGTGDRGWGHAPSSQSARCSSRPGWHSTESLIKGAAARVFARPFAFGWVLGNWLCAGVVLQLRLTSALSKSEMYTATRSLFFSYNKKKMNRFKAPKRKKNNQRSLLTLRFSFLRHFPASPLVWLQDKNRGRSASHIPVGWRHKQSCPRVTLKTGLVWWPTKSACPVWGLPQCLELQRQWKMQH